jgi:hypothetical protein
MPSVPPVQEKPVRLFQVDYSCPPLASATSNVHLIVAGYDESDVWETVNKNFNNNKSFKNNCFGIFEDGEFREGKMTIQKIEGIQAGTIL